MNTKTAEAIERYCELETWFADRNLDELASLCARLATWHRTAYARMAGNDRPMGVDDLKAGAIPWIRQGVNAARPREFLWRLASPTELLELALAAEESEECAAKLRAALGKLGPVDWESAMETGSVPALALGAERRLAR
jgi:hypothetical protein